jgi:hypothetical protein
VAKTVTVTVKHSVSVRLSSSVKLCAAFRAITTYVDVNNNRSNGRPTATARIARSRGMPDSRMARTCQARTAPKAGSPIVNSIQVSGSSGRSSGAR